MCIGPRGPIIYIYIFFDKKPALQINLKLKNLVQHLR